MVSRRSHTVGRRWMNEYEALVKRYWERETELLGENPIQFHFVHHNSKCHGILGLPLWQASEWQPESRHDRQFMFCHGWRVGCLGLLVPVGKTAFEMWWHTHIKQISSFGETDRVHLNRRGASVQSTTGSRGVRVSGSNTGYIMIRGSVKSTGYPLHPPMSLSLPLPCVTACHHISTGFYYILVTFRQLHKWGLLGCFFFRLFKYFVSKCFSGVQVSDELQRKNIR